MSRRRRQLAVRNPDVLLLLPLLARAHCHARIVRTKPVDTATFLAHASRVSPQADSLGIKQLWNCARCPHAQSRDGAKISLMKSQRKIDGLMTVLGQIRARLAMLESAVPPELRDNEFCRRI